MCERVRLCVRDLFYEIVFVSVCDRVYESECVYELHVHFYVWLCGYARVLLHASLALHASVCCSFLAFSALLVKYRVDDAIDASSAHLAPGIAGLLSGPWLFYQHGIVYNPVRCHGLVCCSRLLPGRTNLTSCMRLRVCVCACVRVLMLLGSGQSAVC